MPYTQGFVPAKAQEHYEKHVQKGGEFGNITFGQYCDMADHFLGAPLDSDTEECVRLGGDVIRYNDVTGEFGILEVGGVIGTYFRPRVGRHPFATNLAYFYYRCHH